MNTGRRMVLGVLLSGHVSACGPSEQPHGGGALGPAAGGPPVGGSAAGGAPTTGGASTTGGSPALDPGHKDMHRLNTGEYNATVADLLGTTLQPANGNWRGGELAGFDNMASVLGVDETQYNRYFDAARSLAAEVFASDELRARFVSCELGEPSCVRATLETAGLRLFRRPLAADEVPTYQRVYDAAIALGDTPMAALELVLQALLSSAEFVYRIELDAQPQSVEPHPLSAFELASRLSYFLWSSAPDEALLRAAMNRFVSRRALLRGAGVAIALPWLESLSRGTVRAQTAGPLRRFLPIFLPNGASDFWRPTAAGSGSAWQLSSILEPFGASLKPKLSVVTGLENGSVFSADASPYVEPSHSRLAGAWLTCVNAAEVRAALGRDEANGVSVDQVVAQHEAFKGKTALASLH